MCTTIANIEIEAGSLLINELTGLVYKVHTMDDLGAMLESSMGAWRVVSWSELAADFYSANI